MGGIRKNVWNQIGRFWALKKSYGTALSTIINYFNPNFGYDDFWAIADKMPYIICFKFNDMEFAAMEEIKL